MRIEARRLDRVDVVIVEGSLDLATAPRLGAVLDGRLAEDRIHLVIDLHGVSLLDARTVGVLAGVADRAEQRGGSLRAIGGRGLALAVLQIVGLDKRLGAYDEPGDVLAEAGAGGGDPVEPEVNHGPACPRWPGSRDLTVHALLAGAARCAADDPVHAELRAQAIEDNIAFASRLARRFRDRGEPMDDLTQVALVGLVNAVDGYDPGRGCEFIGYATPTIVGELRRYFRDKGWRIKVPRRLQELRLQVNRARVELSQAIGGSPSVADIARHLDVDEDEVTEAIDVARLYHPISLSAPAGPDTDLGVADAFGEDDPGIDAVDNRMSVAPLLASLPEREQRILTMRFFGNMTQSQIAAQLGISQMHVSRLLTQTLHQLRATLVEA